MHADLPVINVADLASAATLEALDNACRDWGFFYAVKHGLPDSLTTSLFHEARVFFAQSVDAKRTIERTAENPWGYFDRELTKNTPDWKQTFDFGAPHGAIAPQWPAAMPAFKRTTLAYYAACERLSFRLLDALATNLRTPVDDLHRSFQPAHTCFLRINYYPVCPAPARPDGLCPPRHGHLGVNHHTDSGVVTLLLQDDRPGLEVMHDDAWQLVAPRPGALVINIGDILQVWSNDRYRAALHRVLASGDTERFSVPFFLNPAYCANYAPLPATIDTAHPPRYRSINWGEFRSRRAAGDYADHGAEVQITDYRLEDATS